MKILSQGKFRHFEDVVMMGVKETIIADINGETVTCTPDHRFLSNGEWVEAQYFPHRKGESIPVYDVIDVADTNSFTVGKAEAHNCAFLYIDEHAFIENYDDFAASVLPTISSGKDSRLMITSTPNGLNHFYSILEKAKRGINGFDYTEVPWSEVPGRDEAWKQNTLENLNFDMDRFRVEYECEFMGSSGTLISGTALRNMVAGSEIPINSNEGLRVYSNPEKGHAYALIADVSRGYGGDYSAFQVIDITKMPFVQVAAFSDNLILPPDYAEVINRVGRLYNDACVLVEVNDIGEQVTDELFATYEYENILSTEPKGRAGTVVNFGSSRARRGVRTTSNVKSLGCSVLKMLIENNQLILYDANTITELSTFSKKGDSFAAEAGKHDDLVMGLVLFAWLSKQDFFKQLNDTDIMVALKQKSSEDMDAMFMPFGFNNNDPDDVFSDADENGVIQIF